MHGPNASADPSRAPLADYERVDGIYDELMDAGGSLRPHWQPFVESLASVSDAELARRWDQARRSIRDNGVTYNVYGDPNGLDRPWRLDPIPLIVAADEWKQLERGLAQRAAVLDALLDDIYGPQALFAQGIVPPEVVFANPGFLRPCHLVGARPRQRITLYAADLARQPDGRWCVVADRTQSPSGAGYAIENRVIVSQLFLDAFHASEVARMAPFFQRLREAAASGGSAEGGEPRVVLLSPGPYNEAYFEHAYLARYLGYDLVEGADLTTRAAGVFWKTLGGLVPVDAILRRVDDEWCDPLELVSDSALGVAGLVQAAHSGRVRVINPLGSGVLESPAWLDILPRVCEELRNEPLELDATPSYWCGFERSRAHVLENLRELVVKPAFRPRRPGAAREPIFAEGLSESELDQLVASIRRAPYDFVAQQRLDLSTAPSWTGSAIEPRRVMLRAFVLGYGGHYTVLPGGLGRMSSSAEALVVSMQRGGGSKDVWVCSSEPVAHVPMIEPPHAPIELRRGGVRLPSRVADDLFWLGRYAERCESATRVFRAVITRLSDESGLTAALELAALLEILGADPALIASWTGDAEAGAPAPPDRLTELVELVFADGGRMRLAATLERLHHAAWRVRERISGDTWRILNQIRERVPNAQAIVALGLSGAAVAANEILAHLAAVSGLAAESMTRGNAWRFLEAGRRLERAFQTAQLLSIAMGRSGDDEVAVLRAVLEVADSSLTYRSRYLAALQVAPVLDLLLVDETNPRSVGFQLTALAHLMNELPRDRSGAEASADPRTAEWNRVAALAATVREADVDVLAALDCHGERSALTQVLETISTELPRVSDLLARQYFSPAETHRQLAPATHSQIAP